MTIVWPQCEKCHAPVEDVSFAGYGQPAFRDGWVFYFSCHGETVYRRVSEHDVQQSDQQKLIFRGIFQEGC